MMANIKVILVDDHYLILEGLENILSRSTEITILERFTDARQALTFCSAHAVDIVITDLDMPDFSGIDLIRELRKVRPDQMVIVLSMLDEFSIIRRMLRYQVNGYLMKNAVQEELIAAIHAVVSGDTYYNKEVRKLLLQDDGMTVVEPRSIPRLSLREKEVLKLIIAEKTMIEIAEVLHISQGTVKTHRSHIMSKMGAKNMAGIVRIALELGLV